LIYASVVIAHVELIKREEKFSGYLPPETAATLEELSAAVRAGQVVWKVDRKSVNWRRAAKTRILNLGPISVRCAIVGGIGYGNGAGYWYFVHVLLALLARVAVLAPSASATLSSEASQVSISSIKA